MLKVINTVPEFLQGSMISRPTLFEDSANGSVFEACNESSNAPQSWSTNEYRRTRKRYDRYHYRLHLGSLQPFDQTKTHILENVRPVADGKGRAVIGLSRKTANAPTGLHFQHLQSRVHVPPIAWFIAYPAPSTSRSFSTTRLAIRSFNSYLLAANNPPTSPLSSRLPRPHFPHLERHPAPLPTSYPHAQLHKTTGEGPLRVLPRHSRRTLYNSRPSSPLSHSGRTSPIL
jgi:hypothetical protein